MGVLDLDSTGNGERNQESRLRTGCDKGDGTITSTTVRARHDEDDAASRSNSLYGMEAGSLGPEPHNPVHRYRTENVAPAAACWRPAAPRNTRY